MQVSCSINNNAMLRQHTQSGTRVYRAPVYISTREHSTEFLVADL